MSSAFATRYPGLVDLPKPAGGRKRQLANPARQLVGRNARALHGQRRTPLPDRPQLAVDSDNGPPEHGRLVCGDELGALGRARELRQRPVEGRTRQLRGAVVVEHSEGRIEPGRQRVRMQHARAERVDRRDPGALGGGGRGLIIEVSEPRPDPVAQLSRRLFGEGDREDAADVDAVIDHRPDEALDQHGGLAAAGARV